MTKNIAPATRFPALLLSLMLIVSLSACTQEAKLDEVSKLSAELFTAIQNKDYDKALTFYSKEFFSLTSPNAWIDRLKDINSKLGDLQTIKLKSETASTIFSGRRFIFIYTNRYKNGPAKETVVFFQNIEKQEIKIHSHKIESSLLPGSRR